MNFMTRSGLNQQMQGEYSVLLLALSHPRVPSQGLFKGYIERKLANNFLGFEIHDYGLFLVRKFWLLFSWVRILQQIFAVFQNFERFVV